MLTSVDKLGERSKLAGALTAADTAVLLTPGTGTRFAVPANGEFNVTIRANGLREVVRVTAQGGDVLTVQRAQDGTTAQVWPVGACVEIEPTGTNFCEAVKLCTGPSVPVDMDPGVYCLSSCTCLTLTADGRIAAVEVNPSC